MAGRLEWARDRLKSLVRKEMALGPKCFRWRLVMPSGPRAEELFDALIASITAASVRGNKWHTPMV